MALGSNITVGTSKMVLTEVNFEQRSDGLMMVHFCGIMKAEDARALMSGGITKIDPVMVQPKHQTILEVPEPRRRMKLSQPSNP